MDLLLADFLRTSTRVETEVPRLGEDDEEKNGDGRVKGWEG